MPGPSMPHPLRPIAAALLLGTTAACAHAPAPELSRHLRDERCEDAAAFLRGHRRGPPLESRVKQVAALPLSYVLSGVGYTTEAVIVYGGGLVGAVLLCSPVLLVEGAARGSGEASAECVGTMAGAILKDAKLPGLGRNIHEATESWRCADTTPISEDLRAIAECYASRGGEGDLERARRQLDVLVGSREVLRCASREERRRVEQLGAWLDGRLSEGEPRRTD